jgi:hypothetical protein
VSIIHEGWANLLRSVVAVINLAHFNPDELRWANIPEADKSVVFTNLRNAMAPFPRYDYSASLRPSDSVLIEFNRRRDEARLAERRAAEAARAAQLAQQTQRVVRDPEGGINLAAFSRDSQAVHRSSVQEATQKAVDNLAARTVPVEMETLVEITLAFDDRAAVQIRQTWREKTLMELTNDYYNTEAFGQPYGNILDRVWAYIRIHHERTELVRRLSQEIFEGINMCANGKMAHLVNILYAYDEEITALMQNETPSREAFQAKFSTLLNLPIRERALAAADVFREFKIPPGEQAQWLNPMLEAE